MCMIAYQPAADEPLSDEVLANGWDANHDGAGYMFAVNGQLVIRKPFFKLAELREAYKADHATHGAASAFVVHFRWSTHGKKDELNTHPHILAGGRAALVHNGILHDFAPSWKADVSDTVMFCAKVLWGRQPSQLTGRKFGKYLAQMIGERNKLAIMDYRGGVSIVNAEAGVWDGNRWYSNHDYQSRPALPPAQRFCGYQPSALPAHYGHQDQFWTDKEDELAEAAQHAQGQTEEERMADLWSDYMDELTDAALTPGAQSGNIDWEALDAQAWAMAEAAMERDSADELALEELE